MKYENICSGKFIRRQNRFVAEVEIEGRRETVHVKNTGRCRELLIPGTLCFLSCQDKKGRKTRFDLISVEKETESGIMLINMDSQAPNEAAEEWLRRGSLFSSEAKVQREVRFGDSRLDFYIEDGGRRCYMEVKGVTLENGGTASFPDAPTERGVRHLEELVHAVKMGYEAYLLFVVQMKEIKKVVPNDQTHPAFGEALRRAAAAGVQILAVDCKVTADSLEIDRYVPVEV